MKEEELYDWINQILKGTLPEAHPMYEEFKNNPELASELEIQRLVQEAVIDQRLLQYQDLLREHHAKIKLNTRSAINKKIRLSIAAALMVIITSLYWSFEKNLPLPREPTTENLNKKIVTETRIEDTVKEETYTSNPGKIKIKSIQDYQAKIDLLNEQTLEKVPQKTVPDLIKNIKIDSTNQESFEFKTYKVDKKTDPCLNVRIEAKMAKKEPCIGQENGTITVADVRGGNPPYNYSFNAGRIFQANNTLSHVGTGEYNIWVKDVEGCISAIDSAYYLIGKTCNSFKKLAFNPQYGLLDIPRDFPEQGSYFLYDQAGIVLISKKFSQQENLFWDGNVGGKSAEPGIYIYTIRYDSGNEEHGSITIMY